MLLRIAMEVIGVLVIAGLVGAGAVWLGQRIFGKQADAAEPPRDALLSDTRLQDRVIDLSAEDVRVKAPGQSTGQDRA